MSRKQIAEHSYLQVGAPTTRSGIVRIAARGRFLSQLVGTAGVILFSCGFGTSVPSLPGPSSNAGADRLCILRKISLADTPLDTDVKRPVSEEIGLPVGQRAPSFTLKDQTGRDVSLQSLVQKSAVVLVFYRSADWCPYCKQQLVDLQRNLKEIEAGGAQLVGISYDSLPILKRFASKRISFPLLSDSGSRTIDAYNIRGGDDGVARHATFIIDKKGIVRAKLFQVSYAERPALDALVKAIRESQ
ncbi:MAG: putative peroxiredoxin [Acidobacteria bacterium]|nr:putative peroxiredoxin [Acidobacteriota bacterium]